MWAVSAPRPAFHRCAELIIGRARSSRTDSGWRIACGCHLCTRRRDTDPSPTRAWESVAGLLILTLWFWSAANGVRRPPLEVRLEIQYEIPVRQPAQPRPAPRGEADVLVAGPDWAVMFPTGLRRDALLAVLRGALGQLDGRASQDERQDNLSGG